MGRCYPDRLLYMIAVIVFGRAGTHAVSGRHAKQNGVANKERIVGEGWDDQLCGTVGLQHRHPFIVRIIGKDSTGSRSVSLSAVGMLFHGERRDSGEIMKNDPKRDSVLIDLQIDGVKKEGAAILFIGNRCLVGIVQTGLVVGGVAVKLGIWKIVCTSAGYFNTDPVCIAGKMRCDALHIFPNQVCYRHRKTSRKLTNQNSHKVTALISGGSMDILGYHCRCAVR